MPPKRGRRTLANPVVDVEIPVNNEPQGLATLTPISPDRGTPERHSQEETQREDLDDQGMETEQDQEEDEAQDQEDENDQNQEDDGEQDQENDSEQPAGSQPKETGKKKGKKRRRNALNTDYKIYVYKVLQTVDPGLSISKTAMQTMNDLLKDVEIRLSEEASALNKRDKKATLSAWDFQAATKLIIPTRLGDVATQEGTKALKTLKKVTGRDAI